MKNEGNGNRKVHVTKNGQMEETKITKADKNAVEIVGAKTRTKCNIPLFPTNV